MNVTFTCSSCDQSARVDIEPGASSLDCLHCQTHCRLDRQGWQSGRLIHCPVCGCRELFLRKDFNQRVGLGIVAIGCIGSTVAWGLHRPYVAYGVLFATALLDMLMYFVVGNVLQCYDCRSEFRGLGEFEGRAPFRLETHEKYRAQKARRIRQRPTHSDASHPA